MKKYILITLLCLLTLPSFAQGKLIESSEEKRPAWIKRDVDRYDIMKFCQESTISLDNAKEKAFEELTNYIANTVTTYLVSTNVTDTDVNVLRKRVEASDSLTNVSESTAIQTYWEHRLYKKQDLYKYYILYNFNDTEKKKAALEINRKASGTTSELDKL